MDEQRATFHLTGDFAGESRRQQRIWIGSAANCDLRLGADFTISERHANIEWDGRHFHLTDADEANATFVNNTLVEYNQPVTLADGDVVQIGPYVLTLARADDEPDRLEIHVARLLVPGNFLIKRKDQQSDGREFTQDVLLICNPPDQVASGTSDNKLILNHPRVATLHAGISRFREQTADARSDEPTNEPRAPQPTAQTRARFYLTPLSTTRATYLQGRPLPADEPVVIDDGDVAQIGPFDLRFSLEGPDTLCINVAVGVEGLVGPVVGAAAPEQEGAGGVGGEVAANALRLFWEKRTRTRAARRSPLHPTPSGHVGKTRYRWQPTTDLPRPWPLKLLVWCAVIPAVALLGWMAVTGLTAFEPRPLSAAHMRADFAAQPQIASRTNAAACGTCHVHGQSMDAQCAACHQSAAFVATTTKPHQAAGIGCAVCHTEHKGADFRPGLAPMSASFQPGVEPATTCAGCHNDDNKQTYNGKAVHTPHGGAFGYPMINGVWKWPGLTEEERVTKAEDLRRRIENFNRYNKGRSENQVRNSEFHALHDERLRVVGGLRTENSDGTVSCSTCHTSWGTAIDRATPRQTCGVCHNGYVDPVTQRPVVAPDKPNCISCHVQHVLDKHRKPMPQLIPAQSASSATRASD
jgi:hypothetical protein